MNAASPRNAGDRLLAAAQRARALAEAVAGTLRRWAIALLVAGIVAWLTWFDPWRPGSAERALLVVAVLVFLLLPGFLVGRFAVGLRELAGLPDRIRDQLAPEATKAARVAFDAGKAAYATRSLGGVRSLLTATWELRKALEAARITATTVAIPAATVGLGGIGGAAAGLALGVPLLLGAVAGLIFAL